MVYTDQTAVANYLQRSLTTEEGLIVDGLCQAASDWIDAETGRSWGPLVITGEQHTIYGPWLYLRRTPVASIQSATLRSPTVGAGAAPSLVNISYELLDAATGRITIGAQLDFARDAQIVSWGGYIMTFDYTVTAVVPAGIAQAAAALVAHWLLTPDVNRVSRVGLGNVSVAFADMPGGVPPHVMALLSGSRRLVFA